MTWQIHILGASSTLTPNGDSNASLCLHNGERAILIDAGGNIPEKFQDIEVNREDITDIIITHSHPDHTYGLPFLSHSFYHKNIHMKCWSTAEAIPRLKKSLTAYDLLEADRYINFDFREVEINSVNELELIENLSISSIPTDHSKPGFGVSFESNNQTLVYSGDTKPTQTIQKNFDCIDVLLYDCQGTEPYSRYFEESHSSAREIGIIARELNVNTLIPFHYNLTEFPTTWNEIAREIREVFSGTVCYPTRGMGFFL